MVVVAIAIATASASASASASITTTAPNTRVLGQINKLGTVSNGAGLVGGAGTGWRDRRVLAEGDGTRLTDRNTTNEDGGVVSLELALEKSVELCVPWRRLTVLHALRGRRVAWLLCEDLRKLDHGGIVIEGLGKINLIVSGVLLRTRTGCCEERAKGSNRDRVALLATASGKTSLLPLGRRLIDDLRDALLQREGGDSRGGSEGHSKKGEANHCEE
jgi:hypothetical protein